MDTASIKNALEDAQAQGKIVRVYRNGLEDGWVDGYVVGVGKDFFALQVIVDACFFDGFDCLRYCDVTDLKVPAPYARFLEKALLARGQTRASALDVDLDSLPALLRSAAKAFPLVSIFYEVDDDVCYIGIVQRVTDSEVRMLEISPHARWHKNPTLHPLAAISRVDFGAAYEEALLLVASKRRNKTRGQSSS